jgi:hypothetical protein
MWHGCKNQFDDNHIAWQYFYLQLDCCCVAYCIHLRVIAVEMPMLSISAVPQDLSWLAEYKAANEERLRVHPDFAAWLERDFAPIAGGWQY